METEVQIRWKNKGGNHTLANKRRIKKGEIFLAAPSEIAKAFRDVIIPLDTIVLAKEEAIPEIPAAHEIVPHPEVAHRFDVINSSSGKAINDKPLAKKKAAELLESLS